MRGDFHIGMLRSPVTLCNPLMVPDPSGPGMLTTFVDQRQIYSSIEPVSMVPFLLGQQTDLNQITHRVTCRWQDFEVANKFAQIFRDRYRPDGSTYTEVYKIHRVLEVEGRQRFLEIEVELLRLI